MEKNNTDMTINVKILGEVKVLKVYKVPITELYYNDKNDRIATFINEHSKLLAKMDIETRNNEIMSEIIKSNKKAYKDTKAAIKSDGQLIPGVVASDGRVLDGNRRFTCLRELYEKEKIDKYKYFLTAVLDGELSNLTESEIKKIEYNLQFAEEEKVSYDTIDMLVGIYNHVQIDGVNDEKETVLTPDEYIESKKISKQSFNKDVRTIKTLLEYLEYINKPQQFHIARDNNLKEALVTLSQQLNKVEANDERKEQLKYLCFNIMLNRVNVHVSLTHTIKEILKNYDINPGPCNKVLEEYEKITDDIFDNLIGEDGYNDSKYEKFKNSDAIKNLTEKVTTLVQSNKATNIKEEPLNKIKNAIKSVNDVDMNIVKILSDTKNNEFVELVEKLDSIVSEIKGMVDVKL